MGRNPPVAVGLEQVRLELDARLGREPLCGPVRDGLAQRGARRDRDGLAVARRGRRRRRGCPSSQPGRMSATSKRASMSGQARAPSPTPACTASSRGRSRAPRSPCSAARRGPRAAQGRTCPAAGRGGRATGRGRDRRSRRLLPVTCGDRRATYHGCPRCNRVSAAAHRGAVAGSPRPIDLRRGVGRGAASRAARRRARRRASATATGLRAPDGRRVAMLDDAVHLRARRADQDPVLSPQPRLASPRVPDPAPARARPTSTSRSPR